MYCKNCGQKNSEDQNYCQACGHLIKNNEIKSENFNIEEKKDDFCKKCGTKIQDRYCMECGTLGYNLQVSEGKASTYFQSPINLGSLDDLKSKIKETGIGDIKSIKNITNMKNIKEIIKPKETLKKSSIAVSKMLGIGLLISFALFFLISKVPIVKNILFEINSAAQYGYPELAKIKPNFVDFFNFTLMGPIKMVGNFQSNAWGEMVTAKAKGIVNLKVIILLLIPIVAVLVSEFKTFRNEKSTKDNLIKYVANSLIFSILVKIIALINMKSINIQDPYEFLNVKLQLSIQDFWSLLSVFVIVFLIHIGLSMMFKKDSLLEVLDNKFSTDIGLNTKKYLKNMLFYVAIITLGLSLMLVLTRVKAGVSMKILPLLLLVFLPITFIHTWLFSFGNLLETRVISEISSTYGLKIIWQDLGIMKDSIISTGTGWVFLGYLFIILIFLGLVYVIFKTVKDVEEDGYFKRLAFIGTSISIINLLLSYLVVVGIKITSTFSSESGSVDEMLYGMDLGFMSILSEANTFKQFYPLFIIIIWSFVWVFAIGSITYFVREKQIYNKIKHFIEKHNTKIMIAYFVLILILSYTVQSKVLSTANYRMMDKFFIFDMFF